MKKSNKDLTTVQAQPDSTPSGKEMRNWMGVSEKISAKDMEKIDQSLHKGDEFDIDK